MRELPEGWVETTLGEVADILGGFAFKGKDFSTDNGVSIIKIKDIRPPYVDVEGASRVNIDNYNLEKVKKFLLFKGDFLIAMTGATIGKVGRLTTNTPAYLNQRVAKVDAVNEDSHKGFLYYVISSDSFEKFIDNVSSGSSAQQNVSATDIGTYPVLFPPLPEQKAIADMLSSFDDKIELLREQNKTLETLAQTIFKEWFVHFNFPVCQGTGRPDPHGLSACLPARGAQASGHAQAGNPYRNNGGEMVESLSACGHAQAGELGLIPQGWRVGKLGDVGCNIRDGISAEKIEPEMKYVALEHMPRKSIALDSWVSAGKVASNKFIFKKGSILFGKLRPYFHKVGVAVISGICSTDILVIEPNKEFQKAYLLMHLSSDEFIQYVALASEGTRMPRTSWKYMKDYTVCLPPDDIVTSFNALINNLVDKIGNNIFQIKSLSKTRDTLLPKLMSGNVRVQL